MALRDQPYFPLYVQDFMTDEKLIECSAEATGVYIRILCVLHKSEEYGKYLLKQKDKQSTKQSKNFATKFAKQMPYPVDLIERCVDELSDEGVIQINGDILMQKRMVKDNALSILRANSGKKGGEKTQNALKFALAKVKANPENENANENENEDINKNKKGKSIIKEKTKETPFLEGFAISDRVRIWSQGKYVIDDYLEPFYIWARSKDRKYKSWDDTFMRFVREDWGRVRDIRVNPNFKEQWEIEEEKRLEALENEKPETAL